jgi:UDP-glucuronate 4-epimerase
MIIGKRFLITGASGAVGSEIAAALAVGNEVWGLARFRDSDSRERMTKAGVRTVAADLTVVRPRDLAGLLPPVDYVLHFAGQTSFEPEFDRAFRVNTEPAAVLMAHYRDTVAFLHCSSTAVYQPDPRPRREDDPLGDYMRVISPTYSIAKIAAEAVVRSCVRVFGTPTTIARLNVPYSDVAGLPWLHLKSILAGEPVFVRADDDNVFAPIHLAEMVETLPALLGAADDPPTVVNWAGDEPVGIPEWCAYLGELAGRDVSLRDTEETIKGMNPDVTRLRRLVGGPISTVGWRAGFTRMVRVATE